ncbi:MAG: hypothetical protein D6796_09155 [Caldilineae bacterium]|nr:MAG: hypothetical protein D6796_09155 [Caldilineae bacterium]
MDIGLDLQGIILFFIFITPGFLFTRTYLAYRPRYYREPNALEQTALSLIGSAAIHGSLLGAATIGILIVWALTRRTYSLGMLFGAVVPLVQYPLPVMALYLNLATGYLLLSLVVARRTAIFLGRNYPGKFPVWWKRIMGEDPPEPLLLWHVVLQDEPLRKGYLYPRVSLRMRNGDHFEGRLNRLKLVGDEANTIELALTDVSYRPAGASITAPLTPLASGTLLLRSTDILWLNRMDTPS